MRLSQSLQPEVIWILPTRGESESVARVRPQNRDSCADRARSPKRRSCPLSVRRLGSRSDREGLSTILDDDAAPIGRGDEVHRIHRRDAGVVKRCRRHDLPEGVGVLSIDGVEPTKPEVTQQFLDLGQTLFGAGGQGGRLGSGGRYRRGRGGGGRTRQPMWSSLKVRASLPAPTTRSASAPVPPLLPLRQPIATGSLSPLVAQAFMNSVLPSRGPRPAFRQRPGWNLYGNRPFR